MVRTYLDDTFVRVQFAELLLDLLNPLLHSLLLPQQVLLQNEKNDSG